MIKAAPLLAAAIVATAATGLWVDYTETWGASRAGAEQMSQAVSVCAGAVKNLGEPFDAYVDHPGHVEMFGTALGRFQFGKCMSTKGYPMWADKVAGAP